MNVPPPPRPPSAGSYQQQHNYYTGVGSPPPVPPLPSGYAREEPLVAPKPWKVEPDLGVNMARQLDEQMRPASAQPPPPPPPPSHTPMQQNGYAGFAGGFAQPPPGAGQYRSTSPYPPPPGQGHNSGFAGGFASPPPPPPPQHYPTPGPYPPPGHHGGYDGLTSQMGSLSFSPGAQQQGRRRTPSLRSVYGPPPAAPQLPFAAQQTPRSSSAGPGPGPGGQGGLTAPLPNIQQLTAAIPAMSNPAHDPGLKVTFARDVLLLVERACPDAVQGQAVYVADPALAKLAQSAIPLIQQIAANPVPPGTQMPPYQAEALFHRGCLASSGAFPQHVGLNPRGAFRDFEQSARAGHHASWFRLGRDYEQFNDASRARDCFERGQRGGDSGCSYRLAIAYLLGQLGVAVDVRAGGTRERGLGMLVQACQTATLQTPQGPYVMALLMMGEFPSLPAGEQIPQQVFFQSGVVPPTTTLLGEARRWLERSAYLHFAPAQYKLGHAFEFATPPFGYSPLMSVQWYSLASQGGEVEADMALSKWFLCGADGSDGEGGFEKDEALAWTFADKAARKGLPSAEFAMGYYAEVGIGGSGRKDLDGARRWYEKASQHGNPDAPSRLEALNMPSGPKVLSRVEHEGLTETRLVRKRTQAKQRSDAAGMTSPTHPTGGVGGSQILQSVREQTEQPMHVQQPPVLPAAQPLRVGSPGAGRGRGQGAGAGAGGRPYSNLNRVSLADTGVSPRPPSTAPTSTSGTATPPPGGGGGRYGPSGGKSVIGGTGAGGGGSLPDPHAGAHSPMPPSKLGSGNGPTTFAEMGIQGAKAEDKDCVVM